MGDRRRSTLRDVAERAGVSVGTASGVFAGNTSVSESARTAVLAAASEIGYRPRRRPSGMLGAGVTTLGLLANSSHYLGPGNPFFGPVLHGVQTAVGELGISLVSEMRPEGSPDNSQLPLIVDRGQAQGLLIVAYVDSHYIQGILNAGLPTVLINHHVSELPVDSVCAADEEGGYLATRHLLELGHRDPVPAIITGQHWDYTSRNRLAGYHRAIAEAGLTADPAYVREGRFIPESGREQLAALLDLPTPPTAVLCGNDSTAIGAMETLRARGISVPEEFSVVGYDDVAMAAYSVPPLTTIQVDKELLGMQAVWNVVERIHHPELAIRETRLRVRLVERGSTANRR